MGDCSPPPGWDPDSSIQCLVPQDYRVSGIYPIPDRTIGALIKDIASTKGDNITVILDCCHSSSGTRNKEYIPRSVYLHPDIPADLDHDIWGSRTSFVPSGSAYYGLWSHILLAECDEGEFVYEYKERGSFTSALLATFKNCTNDLTYSQLLDRIHLERQNPICEGINRHRVLFNAKVSVGRRVFYPVQVEPDKYAIGAGLAHGVSFGAEFTLYSDEKLKLGVVLVDDASSIDNLKTKITPSELLVDVTFAKLTRIGPLPLYLSPERILPSVLEWALRWVDADGTHAQKYLIVGKAEEGKLEVTMGDDLVIFKVSDQRVKTLGLKALPCKVTLDNLAQVLGAAAHYFWCLDLVSLNGHSGTNHNVTVDFYLLEKHYDDFGVPSFIPCEPGFCREDPNFGNSDIIDFIVDPEACYGIEIRNNTPRDLYFNAFLFNNSSLSIVPFYAQWNADNPEAPLKPGGIITAGYGSGGVPPFSFVLEDGQDVDVGYLKIFFATRPIDLSDIVQESPFSEFPSEPSLHYRFPNPELNSALEVKFAILIPVVQRRG